MGKVTLSDVAKSAEVSIATISRVINQPSTVKRTTLQKVYRVMREMGYENSESSSNISSGSNIIQRLILIVVPNLSNPFYSKIIDGIQDSAQRQNFQCVVYQSPHANSSSDGLFTMIAGTNAAGIILLDPIANEAALKRLDTLIPVVQCAEYVEDSSISFVSIDDRAAAKALVKMMIAKGRRRIALINGPARFKYARLRKEGYLAALLEAGIHVDESLVVNLSEINYESAFSVMTQLLSSTNPPDSCFAVSDLLAAAAIKAAKRANFRISEDFSVAGFDNTFVSTLCDPSITTVSQPCYQMGFLSCEILAEKIANPSAPAKQQLLDTEIIIRDSL